MSPAQVALSWAAQRSGAFLGAEERPMERVAVITGASRGIGDYVGPYFVPGRTAISTWRNGPSTPPPRTRHRTRRGGGDVRTRREVDRKHLSDSFPPRRIVWPDSIHSTG